MHPMHLSDLTDERLVDCPFCGESFAALIDCSAGDQNYVEDCPVCCQPIVFQAEVDMEGMLSVLELHRENE